MVEHTNQFLNAIDPPDDAPTDTTAIFTVLEWLWDTVCGPVLAHLGHTTTPPGPSRTWPRVWWIPTGALSMLPIHAAGHHHDPAGTRRTVLDRVVSSYTPTARSLLRARHRPNRQPDPTSLFVGVNTTTNPTARPLTTAETEARRSRDQAGAGTLRLGPDATTTTVKALLPTAGWAHFACHALPNHNDPAHSHLLLHDGPLTVAELGRMDLPHAYLAYLSACSTATNTPRLIDEAVSVAAAFQLAGYPHVIATLWPIPDTLAPTTAGHIYTTITTVGPAVAVHDTVRTTRDRHPNHPHLWASHIHLGP